MSTNVSGSATIVPILPDCLALRARLEATRLAFHTLVESLPDEAWDSKHTSTNWTVRQLLSHMVDGLAQIPDAIDHVRRGKQFLNLPPFLNWLTAPINYWLVKWNPRSQSRQALLVRYDAAHQALLKTIEGIGDDEWSCGAHCYGNGYKTVLDLCVLHNRHFQEHAAQVAPQQ